MKLKVLCCSFFLAFTSLSEVNAQTNDSHTGIYYLKPIPTIQGMSCNPSLAISYNLSGKNLSSIDMDIGVDGITDTVGKVIARSKSHTLFQAQSILETQGDECHLVANLKVSKFTNLNKTKTRALTLTSTCINPHPFIQGKMLKHEEICRYEYK